MMFGNFSVCSPLRDLHKEGSYNILTVRHPRTEDASLSTTDFGLERGVTHYLSDIDELLLSTRA